MITQASCCLLPTKNIDIANKSYRLRPISDQRIDPSLTKSIREVGFLHPPLLLKTKSGHIILSGRKRIEIANGHGLKNIPCFIIEDISPFVKWQLLLSHAIIGSTLSVIEQANFFSHAESQLSIKQCIALLPLLGHKPQSYRLQEFSRYLSLDPTTIDALHAGRIQPKTGNMLSKLSSEDQQTIVHLINYYKLGGSKQKKLVTLSIDLIMRTRCSLQKIVAVWEHQNIDGDNRPQQALALLNWLEGQCFPKRKAAEKKFQQFQRRLQLQKKMMLQHTPSFEDDGLTLSISFAGQDDFLNFWEKIKEKL
jgi:ParB family chromosome partitioning protein